jgi:hypothetical protein
VARIPWGKQPSWQASVSKSPPRHPFGLLPANNQITAPRVRHGNAKAFLRTDVCVQHPKICAARRESCRKSWFAVRAARRLQRDSGCPREKESVCCVPPGPRKREREMRSKPIRREWPFASDFTQVRLNCFFLGYFPVLFAFLSYCENFIFIIFAAESSFNY